jgi:putative ABC transport system permease protein
VLAVAGLLLARSLDNLVRVDRGFTADDVVAMRINVPIRPRLAREPNVAFHEEVRRRARALPGIEGAAFSSRLPLADALASVEVRVAGGPPETVQSIAQFASPGYLATIGARLLEGRDIADADGTAVPAAVINDRLASRLFGERSALGRRIIFHFMTGPVEAEVVGVTQPVRYNGLAGAPAPELYVDYRSRIMPMRLFARTTAPIDGTVTALQQIVRDVDPTGRVTIDQITTLGREVDRRLARPRFFLALVGTFGIVALVLAAAGLYGVMTFAVSQRRHEMGVRLALGASPPELFRHVVAAGAALSAAGIVIGLGASALAAGALRALLFGVEPWDPVTFLLATGLVAAVTVTACWLPARRAQRTDPLVVLRTE